MAECVMHLADALSFIRGRHQGVVTTIRSGGRPQLSNIVYALGDDNVARISVTDSQAKRRNLRRLDTRASLYVVGDDVRSYVVLDGTAELTPARRCAGSRPRTGYRTEVRR
jgi:PPOX class probable F420-dependent enzyme